MLWPGLVRVARAAGHLESTCVRDRGLSGMKDHRLVRFAIDGDYTMRYDIPDAVEVDDFPKSGDCSMQL